ncbi:hypothetical protein RJT34_13105 [Clitoria ternatea]|uniref:DUF7950 domain-containing protein n=1 Tax=Clitoria ternatea TaxID=43366 RepID=A0AAN9JQA8_CLITE
MESNGECCIARCATRASHDISKVHTIMLRFRPIAPKPLPATTVSDASSSDSGDAFSRSAAAKRKHVAGKRCSKTVRRRQILPPQAVTLPLLPETPDPKDPPEAKKTTEPVRLSFESLGGAVSEKVDRLWFPVPGVSTVTVECVTNTWQEEAHGKVNLEKDTCAGFISDGYGRVTWTNGAYKETVGEGGVCLVMEVSVPYHCRGFTCKVRVQDACGKERTVPCHVWRMNTGAFAWRLDVKPALSLTLAL